MYFTHYSWTALHSPTRLPRLEVLRALLSESDLSFKGSGGYSTSLPATTTLEGRCLTSLASLPKGVTHVESTMRFEIPSLAMR